jgi:hypothetical protein
MADYASKIAQLSARVVDLGKTIADARARRTTLALQAVEGDKAAVKAAAQIDDTIATADRELALVGDAVEQLKKLEAEHQVETEAKYRKQREADAEDAKAAIYAIDQEIDQTLVLLQGMFERRKSKARSLAATGVVDSYLTLRLQNRFGGTSAAICAGLRDYLSLEIVPVQNVAPLATIDRWCAPKPKPNGG